jgi:mRNA interferase MazF
MTTYEFGDVVLVAFPQSGTTARKRRPALVVLDIGDADIVLAPITTRH